MEDYQGVLMMNFSIYEGPVPYLTTDQMIEVDRAMMEDYQIELIQMMENAGRNLAHLARDRLLDGDPRGKQVVVLAGTGGNGGGALVCARRLHNYGAKVSVFVTKSDEKFMPIPARQLHILRRMNLAIAPAEAVSQTNKPDLIIDGIIGYSLKGAPRGTAGDLIRWANGQGVPILALDAPSGVDTTTGTVFDPAIKAIVTMTLALPKEGLRAPGVEQRVGELYLADISVPPELYAEPALDLKVGVLFAESDIIRLR
jgi:NAD(P)H-hydrate epimerase